MVEAPFHFKQMTLHESHTEVKKKKTGISNVNSQFTLSHNLVSLSVYACTCVRVCVSCVVLSLFV